MAQLATDSAAMFKNNAEYRAYAASKGIVLLFSAPYTQKFNAPVERPIRTLVDMAVAMARHANTPRRFMHLAMKFAVRLLNRLFRRMPDGSTDVPLWRYKGAKVPLNLDKFHPWGCAVHVHVERRQRTRFEPKTTPCIFFGYDDAASAAILGKLPGFAIIHSAHAHYNDDDFPCRAMEHKGWEAIPTYDGTEDNHTDQWLGPTQSRWTKDQGGELAAQSAPEILDHGYEQDVTDPLPVASGTAAQTQSPPVCATCYY